jgi:hypothetical protein
LESGIGKPELVQCAHDTGWFDSRDMLYRYLQLYLPKDLLGSNTGINLTDRMIRWLRGRCVISLNEFQHLIGLSIRRHRFTASFIQDFLQHGGHSPHRLLNAHIYTHTGLHVSDLDNDSLKEPVLTRTTTAFRPFDLEKLKHGIEF